MSRFNYADNTDYLDAIGYENTRCERHDEPGAWEDVGGEYLCGLCREEIADEKALWADEEGGAA